MKSICFRPEVASDAVSAVTVAGTQAHQVAEFGDCANRVYAGFHEI